MLIKSKNSPVAERARVWISTVYGFNGQFAILERESQISQQKWKNLYYQRQGVTPLMLEFIKEKHPEQYEWIVNGKVEKKVAIELTMNGKDLLNIQQFPLSPTLEKSKNVKDRLVWVIFFMFSNKGEALGTYLEQLSKKNIGAQDWVDMIYGDKIPSVDMLEVVCRKCHQYAQWVTTGEVNPEPQQDPTKTDYH